MGDFLRYDHFNKLDSPIVVIDSQGDVIYRNQSALNLSRKFRMGAHLRGCFDEASVLMLSGNSRRISLARLQLSEEEIHNILLLPDRSPEGRRLILVMAPHLEGDFCYLPCSSSFEDKSTVDRTATLPKPSELAVLGDVLINAYGQLPLFLAGGEVTPQNCTARSICLFLNRLFARIFAYRAPSAVAKCTRDCADMPMPHFRPLLASLTCLSVLLAVNAERRALSVTIFCEDERPCIRFSFACKEQKIEHFSDLFPGRTAELNIIEAMLQCLSYSMNISFYKGDLLLILRSGKRYPSSCFKEPSEEEALLEAALVEEALSEFFLPVLPQRTEQS